MRNVYQPLFSINLISMNRLQPFVVSSTTSLSRQRLAFASLLLLFTCLMMLSSVAVSRANTFTDSNGKDSTAVERTAHDMDELKKLVPLSQEQEKFIYNMFLSKYQYLESAAPLGERWERSLQTRMRKLREMLGEESYRLLDNAGLIAQWFGKEQNQLTNHE